MRQNSNGYIENISPEKIQYSDDSLFNITSFGTDLTYRELYLMYEEGDLEKPEMQRNYVWTKKEASRFIDSVLLGLPVPSIFLAKTNDDKRLIVDGYQRIMTMHDYMKGVFSDTNTVFKLHKSEEINKEWRGKAFFELTEEQQRRLKTSPIHAIVFEQKSPQDDTGMYQIFERINTGGRTLRPQEIRNCVYHGDFNKLLMELNRYPLWREVLRLDKEDRRMGDVELVLRFFAFSEIFESNEIKLNQINLTKYLNEYMGKYCQISEEEYKNKGDLFKNVIEFLYNSVGENIFRTFKIKDEKIIWARKLHPVVFDAICTAVIISKVDITKPITDLKQRYVELLSNSEFESAITIRTTNVDNIKKRINLASDILFGEK